MMIEKKNIDRLFQEKFKNFEAHPSDAVWNNILVAQKQKKDRKIIPLWWKLGGLAAGLAVLLTVGIFGFGDTTTSAPAIVEKEVDDSKLEGQNQFEVVRSNGDSKSHERLVIKDKDNVINGREGTERLPLSKKNNPTSTSPLERVAALGEDNLATSVSTAQQDEASTPVTVKISKETIADAESTLQEKEVNNKLIHPNIPSNQNAVAENTAQTEKTATQGDDIEATISQDESIMEGKDLVEEAKKIALGEQVSVVINTPKGRGDRWDVGAVAAPVYYGDFGGSGLDPRFKDNDKSGDVNLSYGVQISYNVAPKLKVRGGVSNVDLSYTTNDISFTSTNLSRTARSKNFSQNARALNIADQPSKSAAFDELTSDGNVENRINGAIQQRLNYVEIPLEAVYTLSDKRIGVAIIGGMSTLLLNDNEVFIQAEGGSQSLGSSTSVNDVSFTTNVGVGLDYKITDKLKFNLEPALKYQINGYDNNAGDFKPYYLGVYSGVSFKF